MLNKKILFLSLLVITLILGGCGYSGALYLPPEKQSSTHHQTQTSSANTNQTNSTSSSNTNKAN